MKRVILCILALSMILCSFSSCGILSTITSKDDERRILEKIDKMTEAIENQDAISYNSCVFDQNQKVTQNELNLLSSMFGVAEMKLNRKDIVSSNIEGDSAVFYINYTLTGRAYGQSETEKECTMQFDMVKRDGEWYVSNMQMLSQGVDSEILAEGLNIQAATRFSDGVAFVKYKASDGKIKYAAIDKNGDILYEPTFRINDSIFPSFNNGITYYFNDSLCYRNGILVTENKIYDKKGKVIASSEISGYDTLVSDNCNGYVLAKKTVESFSGDKLYIGVLDNKGNWKVPLSDAHPIIIAYQEYSKKTYGGAYSPKNVFKSDDYNKADTILPFSCSDTSGYNGFKGYYDLASNRLVDNFVNDRNDSQIFKSEYYYNKYVLKTVDNGTGSNYLGIFNQNGQPAFEPIRLNEYSSYSYFPLDEKGFVFVSNKNHSWSVKLYDYFGNVTEYDDVKYFDGFSEGLALVKNSAGQIYYINYKGEKIIY